MPPSTIVKTAPTVKRPVSIGEKPTSLNFVSGGRPNTVQISNVQKVSSCASLPGINPPIKYVVIKPVAQTKDTTTLMQPNSQVKVLNNQMMASSRPFVYLTRTGNIVPVRTSDIQNSSNIEIPAAHFVDTSGKVVKSNTDRSSNLQSKPQNYMDFTAGPANKPEYKPSNPNVTFTKSDTFQDKFMETTVQPLAKTPSIDMVDLSGDTPNDNLYTCPAVPTEKVQKRKKLSQSSFEPPYLQRLANKHSTQSQEENLLSKVSQILTTEETKYDLFGKIVASELNTMPKKYAEETLFQMNTTLQNMKRKLMDEGNECNFSIKWCWKISIFESNKSNSV